MFAILTNRVFGGTTMDALLDLLKTHLDRPELSLPKLPKAPSGGPAWEYSPGEPDEIRLTIPVRVLCKNFQEQDAAAPSYALALAAWREHQSGNPVAVRVHVVGKAPKAAKAWRHFRRSLFLLHEYQELLKPHFQVESEWQWSWPSGPIFHVEGDRTKRKKPRIAEEQLARELVQDRKVRRAFSRTICLTRPFHDKLPMGLFEQEVEKDNAWTPGGASAVDLWAQSTDEQEVHLFELKVEGNRPLGILPEAFYYARMCSYARSWRRVIRFDPAGAGLPAVRQAERLCMWLSAPGYHPLVWSPRHEHSAPLAWLNRNLAKHQLVLGVLPLTAEPGFQYGGRWPT